MSTSFVVVTVVLYQPDAVLRERVPDVSQLAAFVKLVESSAAPSFPDSAPAQELDIVAAIKPGRRARFWFVSSHGDDETTFAALRTKLETLRPPTVYKGPVAFAIVASINGAPTTASASDFQPPMPREWREAAARSSSPLPMPDGILELLWPD